MSTPPSTSASHHAILGQTKVDTSATLQPPQLELRLTKAAPSAKKTPKMAKQKVAKRSHMRLRAWDTQATQRTETGE